jgi:pilus assembly protein Flp/PilA
MFIERALLQKVDLLTEFPDPCVAFFRSANPLGVIRPLYSVEIAMIDRLGNVWAKFEDLLTEDAGQDLVEYAFIILLVALGSIAALPPLAAALAPLYNAVTTAL